MNILQSQQILATLAACYPNVLAVLFEMLHKFGTALGAMIPGLPDQLAVQNGVDITPDGVPVFRAVICCRGNAFRSPMEFGRAIQDALDATCYEYCIDRLRLLRVIQLPGNRVGLVLTWGTW